MAHFAELNSSNLVIRVVVISNDDVNANGGDYSSDAETFVSNLIPHESGGTSWKQTSYNNNARKQYAGVGYTFDAAKNKFIAPSPFASWTLDSNDDWQAPVTYPNDLEEGGLDVRVFWDEGNIRWTGTTTSSDDPPVQKNYVWDATNLKWDEV
jgi:hypothetical protein